MTRYVIRSGNKGCPVKLSPDGLEMLKRLLPMDMKMADILRLIGVTHRTMEGFIVTHGLGHLRPPLTAEQLAQREKERERSRKSSQKTELRLYQQEAEVAAAVKPKCTLRKLHDAMAAHDSFAEKAREALKHFGEDIWVQTTGKWPREVDTFWLNERIVTIPQLIRAGAKVLKENGVNINGWPTEFLP